MIEKNTCLFYNLNIMNIFDDVVAVIFQIIFDAEISKKTKTRNK
jgi:hypothetical protein